ncbi:hypothetical protein PV327_010853 [Microctonus hyperodae]|uniref:Uncharacterized protein n=1 Tax=Microctonus hyperodae TaxID=165561 RepID=A0AA39C8P3_MICHY|nr:hypothetical protein PV327_010853 [Microctonus hyperodae]
MALVKVFIATLLVCFLTLENVTGRNYNPDEFHGEWYVTHLLSPKDKPIRPAVPACMKIDVTEGQSSTYNILMSANIKSRNMKFDLTANLKRTALTIFPIRGLRNPGSYDIIEHNKDEIVVRNKRGLPYVILNRQSNGNSGDLYLKYKHIARKNRWIDNVVDQTHC